MFFTRLGIIAAWLTLIMAAGRFGMAIYIITSIESAEVAKVWASRYLGQHPAQALDHAFVVAAFAIALGILAEISRSLRQRS